MKITLIKIHDLEIITKDFIINYLSLNKLKYHSTQPRISIPIIQRIYKKMYAGIIFSDIKVNNDILVDGHHRFLASLFSNTLIGIAPSNVGSNTRIYEWNKIFFDDLDWDTEFEINNYNIQDARFNNIDLQKVIDILK